METQLLPQQVIERLDSTRGIITRQRGTEVEFRRLSRIEVRDSGEDGPCLSGYATIYDYEYDVAGGPPYGWTESIAAGACRKSVIERDDVRYLVNHDGLPIARTKSGTLILESDDIGLRVETGPLDMCNPNVAELVSTLQRGDVDEMSFAFQAIRQEWNNDYTARRILEVKLFDVSAVTYPANPAAVAQLCNTTPAQEGTSRSLLAMQAEALSLVRH